MNAKTITQMTGREIAQHMGSVSTDSDGYRMREALIDAGYGDTTTRDIPDADWDRILRMVG